MVGLVGAPPSRSEPRGQSLVHKQLPWDGGDVPTGAGTQSHSLTLPSEGRDYDRIFTLACTKGQ